MRNKLCPLAFFLASLTLAQTPPNAPSDLTARAGPGRTLTWECGWDRLAGYGPDSVTFEVWRQAINGSPTIWQSGQSPRSMGCHIVYGRYHCITRTGLRTTCGPEDHYLCQWTVYLNGGEPTKEWWYGIKPCDPGGCNPPLPQEPIWEPWRYLACIPNGGQGCESDYFPVVQP